MYTISIILYFVIYRMRIYKLFIAMFCAVKQGFFMFFAVSTEEDFRLSSKKDFLSE